MKLGALDLEAHLADPSRKQAFVTPMFDTIAPRYDDFTRLFSFGMDRRWKAVAVSRIVALAADHGLVQKRRIDVLDLAAGTAPALVVQLCGEDPLCRFRLDIEIRTQVLFHEGMANAHIGMLAGLLRNLGQTEGRKILVLISAGQPSADIVGGRPNIGDVAMMVGKEAALANASVYALFIDQSETRRPMTAVRVSPLCRVRTMRPISSVSQEIALSGR